MPFSLPNVRELWAQTEQELASRLGIGAVLPRSRLSVLARVVAGASYNAFGRLEWLYRQVFEDTCDGAELERRASIRGVYRKPPSYASGNVTFTGTATTLPAGTRVRRTDGVEYSTLADVAFASGTATAQVQAITAAAAGNAAAATPLVMTSPVSGVSSAAVVAAGGLTGGADQESDDALRSRLLLSMRTPAHGGAPADYVLWALAVPGVTRAWCQRASPSPGDVSVTFVVDGNPGSIVPSPTKVAEVQAYIEDDTRAPATANVIVYAPGVTAIDVDVTLTPDTQAVRDAVTASLQELFVREAAPGQTVYVSHIREAISVAAGEVDHVLNDPTSDATMPSGTIAQLGTVTFS